MKYLRKFDGHTYYADGDKPEETYSEITSREHSLAYSKEKYKKIKFSDNDVKVLTKLLRNLKFFGRGNFSFNIDKTSLSIESAYGSGILNHGFISLNIFKAEDDWFFAQLDVDTITIDNEHYYKCDQLSGVIDMLSDWDIVKKDGSNFIQRIFKKFKSNESSSYTKLNDKLYQELDEVNVDEDITLFDKEVAEKLIQQLNDIFKNKKIATIEMTPNEKLFPRDEADDREYNSILIELFKNAENRAAGLVDYMAVISYFGDEYFFVDIWRLDRNSNKYFNCDTIEGVIQCIKDKTPNVYRR